MGHVLIIEDDLLLAALVQDVLEEEGVASIDVAMSECEAIQAGVATPPSLIVSDVRLRSGTGPSAVAAIREMVGPVPVLFTTGAQESSIPIVSPMAVLQKPFSCSQLAKAYHQLSGQTASLV